MPLLQRARPVPLREQSGADLQTGMSMGSEFAFDFLDVGGAICYNCVAIDSVKAADEYAAEDGCQFFWNCTQIDACVY